MPTGVFVDANVLFSRTLRDWLFLLRNETHGSMFTVCTSEDVIAETMYSIRREIPSMAGAQLTRIHDLISTQVDDRVTDYAIYGVSPVADPHDAHVHAAAVASERLRTANCVAFAERVAFYVQELLGEQSSNP